MAVFASTASGPPAADRIGWSTNSTTRGDASGFFASTTAPTSTARAHPGSPIRRRQAITKATSTQRGCIRFCLTLARGVRGGRTARTRCWPVWRREPSAKRVACWVFAGRHCRPWLDVSLARYCDDVAVTPGGSSEWRVGSVPSGPSPCPLPAGSSPTGSGRCRRQPNRMSTGHRIGDSDSRPRRCRTRRGPR